MLPHIQTSLEAIRYQLERADQQSRPEAQIGMTMIAVSQLIDLVERLYKRIVDLERVQNERAE